MTAFDISGFVVRSGGRLRHGMLYLCLASLLLMTGAEISRADAADAPDPLPIRTVPDKTIQARLNAIIDNINGFADVDVTVNDGVVKLTGAIARQEMADNVEAMISRFEGVVYVDNQIQVDTDVETRVVPAFSRVRHYLTVLIDKLPVIVVALVVIAAFWMLSSLVTRWELPYQRFGRNRLLKSTIRQLLRKGIVLLGIFLALDIMDWTAALSAILGTAGVIGLAIGFAFKDIVENYLAGLLLSFRRPFGLNDLVRIETHEGRVLRLTSSELVLMTLDGNHIRIPNASVFKSFICNYSINPLRRFDFSVGIGFNEDLVAVQRLGCETLKGMAGVLKDPEPFMIVYNLGDFNIPVRFFAWVDQEVADFAKVRSEAIRRTMLALADADIEMPGPTQTVRLQNAARRPLEPPAHPPEQSAAMDISPDRQLDEQMEEDLLKTEAPNLLID